MLRILKSRFSFVGSLSTKVCKPSSLYSTSSISASSKIIMKSPHELSALSTNIGKQSLPQVLLESFKDCGVEKENLIAMVDGGTGQEMTFGDIHSATTRYANAIQKLGYGGSNKCCVAIISPNHRHFFTVFHGTGLAGAYTTTVNPLYTKDEMKFQIEKTNAKVIFSHPFCLELASQVGIELGLPVMSMEKTQGYICVDDLINSESNEKLDMESFPVYRKNFDSNEELMTIPFSSGTTGVPKGVMLTHKNLVANVLQAMPYEGDFLRPTTAGDHSTRGTVLVPLPFFHIYGMIAGMCMPLYAGGKLIFMSAFDLPKYLQLIQDHKVTRSHVVPPIILGLAKHPIIDNYDLSSLKCLMSGAAPLGSAMQIAAADRLGCIVKQAWGMTEISPCGSITPDFAVKSVQDIQGKSGLLVPGTEAKIVDPVSGKNTYLFIILLFLFFLFFL
jgi:acyl-CoA synthetase (AMP-forming)/AMP-acid ligase II